MLRYVERMPEFFPYLPKKWESYSFKLLIKGCLLKVEVQKGKAVFTLEKGFEINFLIRGKKVTIGEGGCHIEEI